MILCLRRSHQSRSLIQRMSGGYAMSRRTRPHKTFDTSTRRLRVLVDMDQVLCNFEDSFLNKFREKFPDEPYVPLEERNTFYIADQYAKLGTELQEKAREIWKAEGFFLNLPAIEGACEAVTEMSQIEDVDVFICTSPLTFYQHCLQEKFKWIEDHLGAEWINRIIIAKDKTMVNGDLLIDDRPRISGDCDPHSRKQVRVNALYNLKMDLRGACDPPSWKQVLFTAPYNQKVDPRGRKRLDSWADGKWMEIIEDFKKRI